MKKIISCLLILTLLLCMVGCFGENNSSGSEKESILPSQGETGSQETGDEATGEEIDGSSTEQNSTAGTEEEYMKLFPLEPDKTNLPSYAALCSIEPGMTIEEVLSIAGKPQRNEFHETTLTPETSSTFDSFCFVYDSSDGPSIGIVWDLAITSSGELVETVGEIVQK